MILVNSFMNNVKSILIDGETITNYDTGEKLTPEQCTVKELTARPYKVFSYKLYDNIFVETLADVDTLYNTIKKKYPEHE